WDFHDAGVETNYGMMVNGTVIRVTVLNNYYPKDELSLDGKTILGMLDRSEPKTLEELWKIFQTTYTNYALNTTSILINHGAFADTDKRDWRFDGNKELPGETGSLVNPVRLVRHTPAPELPGSYLISNRDVTFNVTIRHVEPFGDYDYSYLLHMSGGDPTYFAVPPEYYPSTIVLTPTSPNGESVEFDSGEYWDYIRSNPPQDGVYRQISVTTLRDAGNVTSLQYIQTVKDLLARASEVYRAGNYTGAEVLATTAYIDNFEHVEPDLVAHNATDLKEETEQMLRVELISLIRDRASPDQVDAKIDEINSGLDHAIAVVPEFPAGLAASMAALATL
ncbi:MAG TPA: hypothetical protein VJ742_10160, partial [Nitrososphaera sp.]|nr:hypothetical protein [Nitrososphaera sp.]